MVNKLEKLEKAIGKKYEDWDMDTLVEIVQSKETLQLFTLEVAAYLVKHKINTKIYDTMLPVKYGYYIRETKTLIDSYLDDLTNSIITKDVFSSKLMILKSGKLFSKAIMYLTVLYVLEEEDISGDLEDIQYCIDKLLDIINEVKLETSMDLIADIMDIIDPLRTLYHERYEIDVFDGMNLKEKYEKVIDRLNNATEEMILDKITQEDEDSVE